MPEPTRNPAADERDIRTALTQYLERRGQMNVEKNLNELLSTDMYDGRFDFFMPHLPETAKEKILVSGCAVGSELLVAQRRGFTHVVGTEVDAELAELGRMRLHHETSLPIDLYDGTRLAYGDASFSMIYSAHVIEHTPSPEAYFREHFRVLKPGGFFFLEFPNRYHHTELHTGLPSLEWLPEPLRDIALRAAASRASPLPSSAKRHYDTVRRTLRPVSVQQIRRFMKHSNFPCSKVVALRFPVPGFVQLLVQKSSR